MRVLLANKFLYRFGGTERYVFDQWESLERRGHQVIPFAMTHPRNKHSAYSAYFVSNVEYNKALATWNLPGKARTALRVVYSLEARAKMLALVQNARPDVAHIHNIYHQISPSILPVLRRHGIPAVQTVHDFKLVCPGYSFFARGKVCEACKSGSVLSAIGRRCVKNSTSATALAVVETCLHRALGSYVKNIQLFLTPSAFSRDKLIECGMDDRKVVHVPPPIDLTGYAPNFHPGEYALYFGRLAQGKGLATLLKAMKKLQGLTLVIAGEGEMKQELTRVIERDGLDNVKLAGYVSGEELKDTVRGARFTVVPSECYENAPFAVFESFALGKAVIASRIGGIPELIDDNADGLLFAPGDADELESRMARLSDNPETCLRMGRNGREKLKARFGPEAHYDCLERIYNQLLHDSKASAGPALD